MRWGAEPRHTGETSRRLALVGGLTVTGVECTSEGLDVPCPAEWTMVAPRRAERPIASRILHPWRRRDAHRLVAHIFNGLA